MGIRITGMNSGLDTNSIIEELVKAQRTKVDTITKKQKSLEYKQEAWKELNAKIKKLYDGVLSDMSLQSDYIKKTTKVSDSNAVSVLTGAGAVNGVQSLQVDQLAKSGYLTGAKLSGKNTSATKLSELGIDSNSKLTVKVNGKSKDIDINGNMTIGGLVTSLQNAGVNASFDETNQRLFVMSKEIGEASNFSLEFSDENTKFKLGLGTAMSADEIQNYLDSYAFDETDVSSKAAALAAAYLDELSISENMIAGYEDSKQKLIDEKGYDSSKSVEDINDELKALESDTTLTEEEKTEKKTKLEEQLALAKEYADYDKKIASQNNNIAHINDYITVTNNADGTRTAEATAMLKDEVRQGFQDKLDYAQSVADSYGAAGFSNYATKIEGQDAVIRLNGAAFTSKNNIFSINGLTITAQQETKGDTVTLTTADDTDGIYDKIKGFLTNYNELINEMDKLYNAESAKGYEPLTDEEKEAMSESAVDKWEDKIKGAILRRDETLGTVSDAMKEIMLAGVEINGKNVYLSDFGIETLGYFNSADNEKNAYHIAGDPDDASTKNDTDKLKAAIANDPDSVISLFTGLSKNLSKKMQELMTKTEYSSSFTVYEDIRMKDEYDAYTEKIKKQEEKVTALEDKWYAKFSAMETALAKMQSNQSAVASLLGG